MKTYHVEFHVPVVAIVEVDDDGAMELTSVHVDDESIQLSDPPLVRLADWDNADKDKQYLPIEDTDLRDKLVDFADHADWPGWEFGW